MFRPRLVRNGGLHPSNGERSAGWLPSGRGVVAAWLRRAKLFLEGIWKSGLGGLSRGRAVLEWLLWRSVLGCVVVRR